MSASSGSICPGASFARTMKTSAVARCPCAASVLGKASTKARAATSGSTRGRMGVFISELGVADPHHRERLAVRALDGEGGPRALAEVYVENLASAWNIGEGGRDRLRFLSGLAVPDGARRRARRRPRAGRWWWSRPGRATGHARSGTTTAGFAAEGVAAARCRRDARSRPRCGRTGRPSRAASRGVPRAPGPTRARRRRGGRVAPPRPRARGRRAIAARTRSASAGLSSPSRYAASVSSSIRSGFISLVLELELAVQVGGERFLHLPPRVEEPTHDGSLRDAHHLRQLFVRKTVHLT